jgi:Fur family transcriptional regulator, ferric uptake regulator
MTDQEIRKNIQDAGLRVTVARLLVYKILLSAQRPLSHTDIVRLIQEDAGSYGDQATIYRTLQAFTEKNLAKIASNAGGIARYEIRDPNKEDKKTHVHPHFVCKDCGVVSCLPKTTVITNYDQTWEHILAHAEMQFVGTCKECVS